MNRDCLSRFNAWVVGVFPVLETNKGIKVAVTHEIFAGILKMEAFYQMNREHFMIKMAT